MAGDVAFRVLDSIKRRALRDVYEDYLQEETKIYVCDINPNMLTVGKKRAVERGTVRNFFSNLSLCFHLFLLCLHLFLLFFFLIIF